MYDWPEVRDATDLLWARFAFHLRQGGIDAPGALDRSRPEQVAWTAPDLVVGQTCGLPFSTGLAGDALYLATPHYDARGCSGPEYCSLVVAGRGRGFRSAADLAGARIAYNDRHSLSGNLALCGWFDGEGMAPASAANWMKTGSHRQSLRHVAAGRADIAAIDAVAFALATDHEPEAVAAVEVIAETRRYPGLPLITAARNAARAGDMRAAIGKAFDEPLSAPARKALHIAGLSVLPDGAYAPVRTEAERLAAKGWPTKTAG